MMGRPNYPATPPSSTLLEPRPTELLPEISLGPPHLNHSNKANHNRTASNSYACSSAKIGTSNPEPIANKPIQRKSKPSRKTTHSQIEKRRREKINDTMQRLKDLVPACHDQDLLLRKLDVLTATADYIEELQTALYGRPMPLSPTSLPKTSSEASMQQMMTTVDSSATTTRRSSRVGAGVGGASGAVYAESACSSSSEDRDHQHHQHHASQHSEFKDSRMTSRAGSSSGRIEVDDVNAAAESLLHISESPALRPVERQRLSISELMCLD